MVARKVSPPAVPLGSPLAQALDRNASLADLTRRIEESNARLAAIAQQLPEPLRAQVQAGPIDATGWSLLAANAAVAAKLRQLLPRLATSLRDQGWPELAIRIHTRSR